MVKQFNFSLQNTEWLSNIFRYANITPLKAAIIVFVFNSIVLPLLAITFDAWLPTSARRGFSNDFPTGAFTFLLQPIIFSAFSWIQAAASQPFNKLINGGIIQNTSYVQTELRRAQQRFQYRWLSPIIAVIAVILTVVFVLAFTNTIIPAPVPVWVTVHPVLAIVLSPSYFISFYSILFLLYDLFVVFYTLDKVISKQEIRLEPLHPDNASGLSSIGHFVSNLGYLMAGIGGTLLVSAIYDLSRLLSGQDYALAIYIAIYIFLIPFFFFKPLWSTHLAMVDSRNNILNKLSKEFNSTYLEYLNLPTKSPEKIKRLVERMKQVEEISGLTKKTPVWPFNYDNLRKYFGLSLSPFFSIIFPIAQELLTKP